MSTVITPARIDAFRGNVLDLAQQKGSKLRAKTDYFSPQAETGAWDRLSAGEMSAKSRDTASSGNETGRVFSRRIAIATPWNDHELVEQEDPSMMLVDPKSKLVRSLGYAAGRKMDDIIIAAAIGNATEIARDQPHTGNHTPSSVALPSEQIAGDGTTPMSFDLVTEVQEIFTTNDIDPEEPKFFVIGPRQLRELMNLTENTSADYVQMKQLQQYGMAPNWLGFDWIVSTRLTDPSGASTQLGGTGDGTRACFAATYEAIGLHVPEEMTAKCAEDASQQYAWRPYVQMTLGAVRVEDSHVVMADVLDATNS